MNKKILLVFLVCFFAGLQVFAQSKEVEKILYRAEKLFRIRNYDGALQEYLSAVEQGDLSAATRYYIGICYMNMPNTDDQIKAKPYFEYAVKNKSEAVPDDIYYHLGQTYHKDLDVTKAIDSYKQYKKLLDPRDPKVKDVDQQIRICDNALALISNYKSNIIVENLGQAINTPAIEYNPVVSADESVMAFTRLTQNAESGSSSAPTEEIFITYKGGGEKNWISPENLALETKFNVGTAGISPDGEHMLIFIGGINNTGNLYSIQKTKAGWSTPVTMGDHVNSRYLESTASITPDGKTIYFASNRPGGHGGMDIYSIQKNDNGKWGYAQNLGPSVNTAADEDAPFIHPDQKTLFFTSNGHNTMGGKDIFKTVLQNGQWTPAENMGFPINTPANDNYFTLTADGSKGYFSSDRKGGFGGQDIYTFNMPEEDANIPLTLVKGRILAGETKEPVPTEIKVVDNETSKKIQYVYNPNTETGNYLIIFPPGKNYDMIIESEGYMPYTININIPNQTYYYELYQEIYLKPIKQFDVVVGQEVTVKNVFFDTGKETKFSARQANEAMLVQNDSVDLYDMMDAIISSTDSTALNYLLDLMYNTNPVDEIDFNQYEEEMEAAQRVYYYDESDTSRLEVRNIDGELIYSLPTLYVAEEDAKRRERQTQTASYDKKLLEPVYKIYFEADQSDLNASYHAQLNEILSLLNKHEELGIEISGFASSDGDADYNRKLSNKRAIEVLNYFNHKGIVRRRIIAKGFGAAQNAKVSKEESRRVEIRVVDINQSSGFRTDEI